MLIADVQGKLTSEERDEQLRQLIRDLAISFAEGDIRIFISIVSARQGLVGAWSASC
jgi:hypothetical protein